MYAQHLCKTIFRGRAAEALLALGGSITHLSKPTCLIQPHPFHACFVVSKIITICCNICHD